MNALAGRGGGVALMVLATLLFVSLDTTAKYLTTQYPVQQVVWARFTFHLLFVMVWLGPRLPRHVRTRRPGLQLTRSVLMLVTNASFFFAIRTMVLVDASAVSFVGPLIVTALGALFLGEQVGPRRWGAVFAGFLGAMVIIRPGPGIFESGALFALAAAFGFSFYQLATRAIAHADPPLTTLFYTAFAGAIITSLAVPAYWVAPDVEGWLLMAVAGMFGALGQLALIRALERAPLATVAPFNYLVLVWATLFGFALFGDLPDGFTVAGALIIVSSGLYVMHRERVRRETDVEAGS